MRACLQATVFLTNIYPCRFFILQIREFFKHITDSITTSHVWNFLSTCCQGEGLRLFCLPMDVLFFLAVQFLFKFFSCFMFIWSTAASGGMAFSWNFSHLNSIMLEMLENNHVNRKKRSFINHEIGSFLTSNIACQGFQNNVKYNKSSMKNPLGGLFFPWTFKESQMWRGAYLFMVKPGALRKKNKEKKILDVCLLWLTVRTACQRDSSDFIINCTML